MEDKEKLAYLKGLREMLDFVVEQPFCKPSHKSKLYDFYFAKDRGDSARLKEVVVASVDSGKEL